MPTDRYLDLLKQGFMKPLKVRRLQVVATPKPFVSCVGCMDWHREGKHVKDAATRKANIQKWGAQ